MLILKGKTGHGKNRIREHGTEWKVLTLKDIGIQSFENWAPKTPIQSLKTGEWRWLDNVNFEVVQGDVKEI
jgi:hypothetical protein